MFQTGQVTTKGLTVCLVRQLWFYYCFGTSFWKTDWHGITIIYVYVCSLQTAHRLFFKKFFCGCLKKSLLQISYLISHIEDMIQDCLFFLGTKRKEESFNIKLFSSGWIYPRRTKFLLQGPILPRHKSSKTDNNIKLFSSGYIRFDSNSNQNGIY